MGFKNSSKPLQSSIIISSTINILHAYSIKFQFKLNAHLIGHNNILRHRITSQSSINRLTIQSLLFKVPYIERLTSHSYGRFLIDHDRMNTNAARSPHQSLLSPVRDHYPPCMTRMNLRKRWNIVPRFRVAHAIMLADLTRVRSWNLSRLLITH